MKRVDVVSEGRNWTLWKL